ncbi:MAG: tRNA (N(6)-L-threonylcarbamoyladenosine(37)-C(2))-methylthiotransferase MtaB [Candidatus Tectomicrobia bacterium]|uniref:Threonylcarbamoyladenosine tRNA methylthiotransferase MtaB n=1 Tax=Tectimicrobiota bacterium TaxID=2528274 RepID=A0A933LPQ5_UNCTE|nr:tRNA (N(6)-L-threonylcarbamoyladenosine(37)-C(2))-methylthiotransferase MtaB [Candidatus Tectomicrobia bacterium]
MRVALTTLGCKLNQFETEAMQELLEKQAYDIVPFEKEADVYVINTCTVTSKSDYRSRGAIRRALQKNQKAKIIVTGCYAQTQPKEIAKIPGVDVILGNQEKSSLLKFLDQTAKSVNTELFVAPISQATQFSPMMIEKFSGYTRAFVKIQDGCDSRCSYCIVSTARGPNRSEKPEAVLRQISALIQAGYQEVVFTGVHLGTYGFDLQEKTTLAALLRKAIQLPGLKRLRLSSLEPAEFTPDLIDVIVSSPVICQHLHIPLQSGDDEILTRMNRGYNSAFYAKLILDLKSKSPDMGIGADVIVGFPGEEERHFKSTYNLIEALPLTYLHVFNFSGRKGTLAADMDGQVPAETRHSRSEMLRKLGKKKSSEFKMSLPGREMEIIIESSRDKETALLKGLTGNYVKVLVAESDDLMNKLVMVKINDFKQGKVYGRII